jgi:hypothetical protein
VAIPPIAPETVDVEEQRLASTEDFVTYLRAMGGTAVAADLELFLDAASERLNAKRQFYGSTGTRTVHVDGTFVRIPDLNRSEACTVIADGHELTAAGLRFLARTGHPAHAVVLYQPARELVITGKWGFDPCPEGVRIACMDWAAQAYFRRQARQADVTVAENGATSTYFARMPSTVRAALEPYVLP